MGFWCGLAPFGAGEWRVGSEPSRLARTENGQGGMKVCPWNGME
jgi:hypothetical protein